MHALNPIRVQFITRTVAPCITSNFSKELAASAFKPLQGMRAVDIGCGGGLLSESLARLGANVTGIDPTSAAIMAAKTHATVDPLTRPIDYRCTTVDKLVESSEKFDLVCSLEVVEHTPDPKLFLENCSRLVAPGGAIVVSTLNRTFKAWALAILGAEHIGRFVPVGTHDWSRFLKPSEIQEFIEGSITGMKIRGSSGIVFKPERLYPLESSRAWDLDDKDLDVNFIMFATREMGPTA